MRIAVNTRFLLPDGLEGLGQYTHHLVRELVRTHPDDEFIFFFDRPYDARYVYGPNVTPVVLRPPARHPLLWWVWFELMLPRALRRHRADVLFSPDSFCSLRSAVPTVLTVHDLGYLHYPEQVRRSALWYYRRYFPRYVARAERVVAISQFVKDDLTARFGTDPAKITVAHNAPAGNFAPVDAAAQTATRRRFTAGQPYFLYLGAIQPRKNVATLIRAFDRFKTVTQRPERLVLAGRFAWRTGEVEAALAASPHRAHIVLPGFVSAADRALLLGSARAFVLPSYLEGFGLPVLEAMAAGVPVITSDTTALPEVAGGAALLADPHRPAAWSAALRRLAYDDALHADLVMRGRRNAARFTWLAAAGAVYAELHRVSGQPAAPGMG